MFFFSLVTLSYAKHVFVIGTKKTIHGTKYVFLTIVSLVTKGISLTFLNCIKFVSTFLRQFLFHANNLLKREVNAKSWCSQNRRYMVTITFKRSRRQRKIKRLNKVVDEFSILIN